MDEQELAERMQAETVEHNKLAQMAHADGRDYITPEDVGNALTHECTTEEEVNKIRLDVLEIMTEATGFSIEDKKLTAYVAFKGKED